MKIEMHGHHFHISFEDEWSESSRILYNHCHENYELLFIIQGNSALILNDKKYLLTEGSACVIPPYRYHNIELSPDMAYKRLVIQFEPNEIPKQLFPRFNDRLAKLEGIVYEPLIQICKKCVQLVQQNNTQEYHKLARAYLTEMIYVLADCPGSTLTHELTMNPLTLAIISYIDAHLYEHISINEIAQAVFSSPSNVCHVFKEDMNTSILQFAMQKKIAEAKRLLTEGMQPITVSEALGFGEYSGFYRTYKKLTGQTPFGTQKVGRIQQAKAGTKSY